MATILASRPVTVDALKMAVEQAWTCATSADPSRWAPDNSAWGQCAVTALVVQDYLGGELRRGEVGAISHYWNVLGSGKQVDLTRHQFGDDVEITNMEERAREYLLSHVDTARRYSQLRRAVRAQLHRRL
jgi:hypothetical protein